MTAFYAISALLALFCLAVLLAPLRNSELPQKLRLKVGLLIAVILLPAAGALYWYTGAPHLIPVLAEYDHDTAQLNARILQLTEQTKKTPEDTDPWVELGSLLLLTQRYEEAVSALRNAVRLTQGHPSVIMLYAKALISRDGGNVSDDAAKSLRMVLLQDKKNADARYWLGTYHLQKGEKEKARALLKPLHDEMPDMAPLKARIRQMLEETQR